jgi:mono/diheme cytochrome c family protein
VKELVPIPIKIALLVLGSTALYTYIGQLVPQKMVLPPPPAVELAQDATPEELARLGAEIAHGKGLCFTCHTTGKGGTPGLRFPDLDGIATRAGSRIEGMDALQYLAHSIYHPDEFIVAGFNPGMPKIDKPPIGLTDQEILTVLAYLQTLGGTATVTPATTRADLGIE